MKPHVWFVCGALLAGVGVINGAYAAHGLDRLLAEQYADPAVRAKRLAQYETGVRYQMYGALGLLAVGLAAAHRSSRCFSIAGVAFLAGVALFSGLLYLLVLLDRPKLGAVVPIGGVAMIAAWFALACGALGGLTPPSKTNAER